MPPESSPPSHTVVKAAEHGALRGTIRTNFVSPAQVRYGLVCWYGLIRTRGTSAGVRRYGLIRTRHVIRPVVDLGKRGWDGRDGWCRAVGRPVMDQAEYDKVPGSAW